MDSPHSFEDGLTALLPRLRRFAHALSRNAADADDLTQATVERALRSRGQWEPGTRLDSWLYRIMRNIWIDTVRSRGRKEDLHAPVEEAERIGEDPRRAIEASIDLRTAMNAMQQLPDEQREIVALILIEGLGYRECSEILGLPLGTVSSRLVRGRNALLKMIGE
ncbi:MAG TPA: RNA polymerase sigma factor [Sphingomicrobium sp.]|nr:RNA polymerase sigma factor [Sphingomicrobium sp.]